MSEKPMPHPGHENHLCYLHSEGHVKEHFEDWKNLVKDGKFVCGGCGRVAGSEENLCKPEKL
jgi:hypothetical protein